MKKNPRLILAALVGLTVLIVLALLFAGPVFKKAATPASTVVDKTLFLEIRDDEGNFLCATPRCRGFYAEERLPQIQEWITAIAQTPNDGQRSAFREMITATIMSSDRLLLSVRRRDPLAGTGQDPQPAEGEKIDEFPYTPPPPDAGS